MRIIYLIILSIGFIQAQSQSVLSGSEKGNLKDSLYTVAKQQEDQLLYREAYCNYVAALDVDSTDQAILKSAAQIAINLGRKEQAMQHLDAILKLDSLNFFAAYQQGRLFAINGNYDKALAIFGRLQQRDTTIVNPILAKQMGDCYWKLENLSEATMCYIQGAYANPENVPLATSAINGLMRIGGLLLITANSICDSALIYNPDNHELLGSKGKLYFMNKQYADADSIYQRLLLLGDSSLTTLKYAGISRFYSGKYMDSVDMLETAYKHDSTDVETVLLLGSALGRTSDRERAFLLFDQAEDLMQPPALLVNLLFVSRGETLIRDGQLDKAITLFFDEWKKNKNRTDYLSQIVNIYSNQLSTYTSEEEKAKALYLKSLYISEQLRNNKSLRYCIYFRPFFQSLYEEAFFKHLKEIPMLSPDGKKNALAPEQLKFYIDTLSELEENSEVPENT